MNTKRIVQKKITTIGKKIKAARTERRMTQKELAEKCGLSQQVICNIERGIPSKLTTLIPVLSSLDLSITLPSMEEGNG